MRVVDVQTPDRRRRCVVIDDDGNLVAPVVRYLKHLDKHRGFARNTQAQYAIALKWYWQYIAEYELDWRTPTIDSLGEFVAWLKSPLTSSTVRSRSPITQPRSDGTINDYLSAVIGFYEYMRRMREVAVNLKDDATVELPERARSYKGFLHGIANDRPVVKNILKQGEDRRIEPKTIPPEQVRQLRDACGTARDRLLIGVLYETGMRIGEALALWVEDIDAAELVLHVRDRGDLTNGAEIKTRASERALDVSEDLAHEVMLYVAAAHTSGGETNHLFVEGRGATIKPLTYAAVDSLFRRLRRKTGIDATPHILRHTHLTTLAEEGWPPEKIQKRAGHAQFQYTYQTYIHPSRKSMREEWERTEQALRLAPRAGEDA